MIPIPVDNVRNVIIDVGAVWAQEVEWKREGCKRRPLLEFWTWKLHWKITANFYGL